MKYTKSTDGVERATYNIKIRLSKDEFNTLQKNLDYLKGEKSNMRAELATALYEHIYWKINCAAWDLQEHSEAALDRIAEMDAQAKVDMQSLMASKTAEIKQHTVSEHDYQVSVAEGKALRSPGKRIKFEPGVYYYSPDGEMVTCLRKNEASSGYEYGDVWEYGWGRRKEYAESLKALIARFDKRYPRNERAS